jgi:hypothetical protein
LALIGDREPNQSPNQSRPPRVEIAITVHGDVVDLGPLGALRRSMVAADWGSDVPRAMRRR